LASLLLSPADTRKTPSSESVEIDAMKPDDENNHWHTAFDLCSDSLHWLARKLDPIWPGGMDYVKINVIGCAVLLAIPLGALNGGPQRPEEASTRIERGRTRLLGCESRERQKPAKKGLPVTSKCLQFVSTRAFA
jgi:hypothetical protein